MFAPTTTETGATAVIAAATRAARAEKNSRPSLHVARTRPEKSRSRRDGRRDARLRSPGREGDQLGHRGGLERGSRHRVWGRGWSKRRILAIRR